MHSGFPNKKTLIFIILSPKQQQTRVFYKNFSTKSRKFTISSTAKQKPNKSNQNPK
tara:strand:+ start:598 stop:765 length:168 start_codon:yes stop_codon:yes gene_type:complete